MSDEQDENTRMEWLRLELALKVHDNENRYWSKDEVLQARAMFINRSIPLPSMASLQAEFGDRLESMASQILEQRAAWISLQAKLQPSDSPCMECGGSDDLKPFEFGLARVIKKSVIGRALLFPLPFQQ